MLSLRGEKHAEFDDKDRRYSERCYGQFERRIILPADVDDASLAANRRAPVPSIVSLT